MTLQTLAAVAVGGLLGARIGTWATMLYLALILSGLPLLAGGGKAGGAAFLQLKSGGYLIGFIPAAWIGGFLGRGVFRSLAVALLAHCIILGIGGAWLARFIGAADAMEFGVAPFLWGALVKSVAAAALVEHFAARKARKARRRSP